MKRVILCRPEGPRNLGAILRVTQNFGPCELWVVSPARPTLLIHPEFEQMSHGAESGRSEIVVADGLREALADVNYAIGFTARIRGQRKRRDWRTLAPRAAELAQDPEQRVAIVLGNEVSGLTAEEADLCQELAHIRTSEDHTSLNLAMCAGIVLSDLFAGTAVHGKEPGGAMLNGKGREFLKTRATEVFARGLMHTPAAREEVQGMIERVFSRAPFLNKDARAFHLILKTLGSTLSPSDLGLTLHHKGGRKERTRSRYETHREAEAGPDPEE